MHAQGGKKSTGSQISNGKLRGAHSRDNLSDNSQKPIFKAMRPPSQASQHRVDQLQEMIEMKDLQFANAGGAKAGHRPSKSSANKYVPGQEIQKVYAENETRLNNQRQKVLLD